MAQENNEVWKDFILVANSILGVANKTALLADNPAKASDQPTQEELEVLRIGIIAELDAVSLYEQLAEKLTNPELKKILLDIAKEEKTHVGEFQALLQKYDPSYASEMDKGKIEVEKKGRETDVVEGSNIPQI